MGYYKLLKDRRIVEEPNIVAWAMWFKSANRIVKQTQVAPNVEVSTVFLGLDHQFGDGPPLLFETMIFGGNRDGDQWRYSTYTQAAKGHKAVVSQFNDVCSYCGVIRKQDAIVCPQCGGSEKPKGKKRIAK